MSNLLDGAPLNLDDQDAVDAAAGQVRGYCRWHIAPLITETITLDGPWGVQLLLPSLRVVDVAAVTVGGVEVANFECSESGILTPTANWFWGGGPRGITVTLTHGYPVCPPEIRQIVAQLAASEMGSKRVKSSTEGPYSVSYADADSVVSFASVLDRYRISV